MFHPPSPPPVAAPVTPSALPGATPSATPAATPSATSAVHSQPGQRIFEDAAARIWSADVSVTPQSVEAVLFTCLTDPREDHRALSPPPGFELLGASADALRRLLSSAPKVASV